MKEKINTFRELKNYLLLWGTQTLSGLGSAMTSYALVIWSYTAKGSALSTALLMVCSYAPYVVCSVFAGALCDRWNKKKTLLCCDAAAALCSFAVLVLLRAGALRLWHLYIINALSGLMNTVQQPAGEVAVTALLPRRHYQKAGSFKYLGNSLNSILAPITAAALLGLFGIEAVILLDIASFAAAFLVLLFFIDIPESPASEQKEPVLRSAAEGVRWLRKNPGIFHLMLFLAAINLVASVYNAAFPAMVLSKASEQVMGTVNSVIGAAMLLGSVAASLMKAPKSRISAIWGCLMLSMCTENFFLAFGDGVWLWSAGACLGWIAIPWMNANLDAVNRLNIPIEMQGRVFAARNSFQFFTIPLGYLLGGVLVDRVFEPFMAALPQNSLAVRLFGAGKGSGAAMLFAVLWLLGIAVCAAFKKDKQISLLEKQ